MLELNAAKVFKVLSNSSRLKLLIKLSEGREFSLEALSECIGEEPALVSRHMGMLVKHHLAFQRHQSLNIFYQINEGAPCWVGNLLGNLKAEFEQERNQTKTFDRINRKHG